MASVINSFRMGLSCQSISKQYLIHHQNSRQFYNLVSNYLTKRKQPNVAVLNLCGMIQADMNRKTYGGVKKLNLESLHKSIDKTFATKKLSEVCLLINSPGGSPVQSELIANRIMHLSKTKKIDVVSFVEDYAVSGGYWLACAGKEIYTAESSLAGSIGVVAASFGLHNFIKRYDIERRVETMGKNKAIWDIFQPESLEDKEIIQRTLNRTYVNFTNFVKQQRGSRLKAEDDILFTGEFWVGKDAVDLGLTDGIKTLNDYLHEKYGDNVNVVKVNPGNSGRLGAIFGSGISISDIEDSLFCAKHKFM